MSIFVSGSCNMLCSLCCFGSVVGFCYLICSVTAAFLGTMSTMWGMNKAQLSQPLSHSGRYRSCPSPAAPRLNPPKLAGELGAMTGTERQRWTPHPSSIIIIITLLFHTITLTVIPLAINRQYPPMPTSTMPTCPHFSQWPMGGSRSVC